MNAIMFDIETLGRTPGSLVLSIGAVEVDLEEGTLGATFHVNIDLADSIVKGLTVEQETVAWWQGQSEEAKALVFNSGAALPLVQALVSFSTFYDPIQKRDLYCCGPSFDVSILEAAYRVAGVPVPWEFYRVRDYRTLREWYPEVGSPPTTVAHDALEDAKWQAQHLISIYQQHKKEQQP